MNGMDTAWYVLSPIRAKAPIDNVPKQAGLYKLAFSLWDTIYVYIGQADNIRRRIREYTHNPTKGNAGEHFHHDLFIKTKGAELSVCCLGLNSEKDRESHERIKIAEARQQGIKLLNRGEPPDNRMLRFRLESEERMLSRDLERVRSKLAKL